MKLMLLIPAANAQTKLFIDRKSFPDSGHREPLHWFAHSALDDVMISAIIVSAVPAGTAVAEAPVPTMSIRTEWILEAKSLLPSVQATDRPAAYRNYADMLVEVGQCDTAIDVFENDASFDAELIVTAMAHASSLGERHCAGQLGKLAASRIGSSTSTNPLRRAQLRMAAGAAIRVGGDDAQGTAMIADAEKTLEATSSETSMGSAANSVETLWRTRGNILGTYAGTPLLVPTMTQYGRELAANLSRSKSYLSVPVLSGFVVRFAASSRTDLVDLVVSKLWPSDRREVVSAANMARAPEIADIFGDKAAPHCVKPAGATGSKAMISDRHGPFEMIVELSLKSYVAAMDARCAALR